MSINYSTNQYDNAFVPKHMQNYQVPKKVDKYPKRNDGCTEIAANDRGHLIEGVERSQKTPWGPFVGTWDMPVKVPGTRVTNATGRTVDNHQRLLQEKEKSDFVLKAKKKSLEFHDKLTQPVPADAYFDVRSGAKCPTGDRPEDTSQQQMNKSISTSGAPASLQKSFLDRTPDVRPKADPDQVAKPLSPVRSSSIHSPGNGERLGSSGANRSPKPMSPLVEVSPPAGHAVISTPPNMPAPSGRSPIGTPSKGRFSKSPVEMPHMGGGAGSPSMKNIDAQEVNVHSSPSAGVRGRSSNSHYDHGIPHVIDEGECVGPAGSAPGGEGRHTLLTPGGRTKGGTSPEVAYQQFKGHTDSNEQLPKNVAFQGADAEK